MLKKYIVLISTLALLLPTVAQAQTATPTATQNDLKKSNLMTIQEKRQELKAELQSKKDEFKTQVAAIKDARKKSVVENIDAKVASSNTNLTTKMTALLDRMTIFLTDLKSRAAALKAQGKDTAGVEAAISAAELAILNAKTAVDAQKTKTYTATITNENALRSSIGQMVSSFRLDIQNVHKTVVAAKQALMKVVTELARLGVTPNTATGSATINQ